MSEEIGAESTREEEERVDRGRRTLLKAGVGLGAILLLAYLLWPSLERILREGGWVRTRPPSTKTLPPSSTAPATTAAPTTGPPETTLPPTTAPPTTSPPETTPPGELGIELPGLPTGSPLGSLRPYLTLEPLAAASSTSTEWDKVHLTVQLKSSNLGGGPSAALLEVLLLEGDLGMPLKLSSLPRVGFSTIYLPPGSSVVRWYEIDIPMGATGVYFVLTDPLLDPCPRSFSTVEDLQAEIGRHIVYYGK